MTYKGRLPEKPIRPNIAGRLDKRQDKTNGRTDRQTPRDSICVASRGKDHCHSTVNLHMVSIILSQYPSSCTSVSHIRETLRKTATIH